MNTTRPSIVAPYIPAESGQTFAAFTDTSRAEVERLRARQAIAIEHYVAPGSRFMTAVNYTAGIALVLGTLAMLVFGSGGAV